MNNTKICKNCANFRPRSSGLDACIGSPDISLINGKPLELAIRDARYFPHYCGYDAKWFKQKESILQIVQRVINQNLK